jgi:hypothetical protein
MKHFTVEEANAALEHVRPLAEELVETYLRLRELQRELDPLRAAIAGNGDARSRERLTKLTRRAEAAGARVAALVERIEQLGAQVKDLETGLVDFPAAREGETVLLCWRVGEPQIGFWHGLVEGFAGRRPLPL